MSILDSFKLVELITTRTDAVVTIGGGNNIKFNSATHVDLDYPAYIQMFVDEKGKKFAIKVCKETDPQAVKFSRPKGEQKYPIKTTCATVVKLIRKMMDWEEDQGMNAPGAIFHDEGVIIFALEQAYPVTSKGGWTVKKQRDAAAAEAAAAAQAYLDENTARNVLTRLLRLSQCTGGFIRDDEGGLVQEVSRAKLEALEDIIDECMEQGKKVVVFARFVPEIDSIAKMLQKKKIGYALIKGDVTDRGEQVEAFQNDPDTKVFIGQLQTTGMGLTLTAGTVAVYYSLDFSYANYEQSRARIRRIGQTKRGVYIHLVCKDTIDEKVMAALKQKADVSKLLVDDYKKLIGG